MLIAPIIHARTKNNDFPSGLLVIPNDFSATDVSWARKYITQSTRYFEVAGSLGRRVIFSNQNVVVTGLSIRIRDLYILCGQQPKYDKVDGNRTNFAFIGLVIPKNEIADPFDIPYTVFLDQYEAYMQELWDNTYEENGLTPLKAEYTHVTCPSVVEVCDIPNITDEKTKCILDDNYAPLDSICAKVTMLAKESAALGFCSDIPNASSVIDSDFTIVTAKNAQKIIDALEREEKKKAGHNHRPADQATPYSKADTSGAGKVSSFLSSIAPGIEKTWKAIPKAVKIIGGFVIVVLASTANKKSD